MEPIHVYSPDFVSFITKLSVSPSEKRALDEWIFIGGSCGRCLDLFEVFRKMYRLHKTRFIEQCCCGNNMRYNYYLMNKITHTVLVVCEDCSIPYNTCNINVTSDYEISRGFSSSTDSEGDYYLCRKCGAKNYDTNVDNTCIRCRGKEIMTSGKHSGKSFGQIEEHHPEYSKWVLERNGRGSTLNFYNWLVSHRCKI